MPALCLQVQRYLAKNTPYLPCADCFSLMLFSLKICSLFEPIHSVNHRSAEQHKLGKGNHASDRHYPEINIG
jgi:hypothetical protein